MGMVRTREHTYKVILGVGCALLEKAVIVVSTFFLPGFLIGLFACWHRGILKTLLAHPSVFLLPVFSHFTFASNSKPCCQGGDGGKSFIAFSPKYTAINVGVSVAGILTYCFSLKFDLEQVGIYLGVGLPCSILGLILTLFTVFSNKCNCCKGTCCCSSFLKPFEFGALDVSSPHVPFILGPDGELVREGEADIEENKEKEMEMEESNGRSDPIPSSASTSNIVVLETEVELEANKVVRKDVDVEHFHQSLALDLTHDNQLEEEEESGAPHIAQAS